MNQILSFHRSVHRYLRNAKYEYDALQHSIFEVSRNVLVPKRKGLKTKGLESKPNQAEALDKNEEKLWSEGQLGNSNAEVLQNALWYYNTQLLGLRGYHEHRQLKWGDRRIKIDANEEEYL